MSQTKKNTLEEDDGLPPDKRKIKNRQGKIKDSCRYVRETIWQFRNLKNSHWFTTEYLFHLQQNFSSKFEPQISYETTHPDEPLPVLRKQRFYSTENLVLHKERHAREKLNICSVCSKAFEQHLHLQPHMKVHTTEKSYFCEVCSKPFASSCSFKHHIAVYLYNL